MPGPSESSTEAESASTHPAGEDAIRSNPPPPPESQVPPAPTGIRRVILRLPAVHSDFLPEPLHRLRRLIVRQNFLTLPNIFGIWRKYWDGAPSYDPESTFEDLVNSSSRTPQNHDGSGSSSTVPPSTTSYSSYTAGLLMDWLNNGKPLKSNSELDDLVNNFMLDPDFDLNELRGKNFSARQENLRAEKAAAAAALANAANPAFQAHLDANFKETAVDIEVPSGSKDHPSWKFSVPGLQYRPLLGVIQEALIGPLGSKMHLTPYALFHTPPTNSQSSERQKPTRLRQDLIDSDVFLDEHKRINRRRHKPLPKDPECKLERIIVSLMTWSDATQLANFGTAKLWPIYLMFGNLSKYVRSQPSSGACEHIAYIPSVGSPRAHVALLLIDSFFSSLTTSMTRQRATTLVGKHRRVTSWLIVAVSYYMQCGHSCLMTISLTPITTALL